MAVVGVGLVVDLAALVVDLAALVVLVVLPVVAVVLPAVAAALGPALVGLVRRIPAGTTALKIHLGRYWISKGDLDRLMKPAFRSRAKTATISPKLSND